MRHVDVLHQWCAICVMDIDATVAVCFRQVAANCVTAVISSRPAQLQKPYPWWRWGAVGATAVRDNPRDYRSLQTSEKECTVIWCSGTSFNGYICDNLGPMCWTISCVAARRLILLYILNQFLRSYNTSGSPVSTLFSLLVAVNKSMTAKSVHLCPTMALMGDIIDISIVFCRVKMWYTKTWPCFFSYLLIFSVLPALLFSLFQFFRV